MRCTSCENCHILIITNSSIDPRYISRLAGAADLHEEGVLPREPEVLAGGAGAQARPRQRHQDQEESQGDLRVSLLRPQSHHSHRLIAFYFAGSFCRKEQRLK